MAGKNTNAAGEALLWRLRRLLARAAGVERDNRRQLLILIDDIETTRRGLVRERDQIQDEMGRAAARATAIAAYLRSSRACRELRRNSQHN